MELRFNELYSKSFFKAYNRAYCSICDVKIFTPPIDNVYGTQPGYKKCYTLCNQFLGHLKMVIKAARVYSPSDSKRIRIKNTLSGLRDHPYVSLVGDFDGKNIFIRHKHTFVPDFEFVWSEDLGHYRVYIHLADSKSDKSNAGYSICVVGSGLAASGFCMLYGFLLKNRSNKKSDTVAVV